MLAASDRPLCEGYDVIMLDLDGVVYIDGDAVPAVPERLRRTRERGARLAFVTNNASRRPSTVSEHLVRLGIPAEDSDVVTSSQAAARLLLERFGASAPVVVLGGDGLHDAVRAADLEPVATDAEAQAVVTGYGPDVVWGDVMRVAVRIRGGLPWVASNTDMTFPTRYGTAPGHGVLVDTLRRFADVEPVVAGKPARPLLDETVRRTGARRALMVGDRLDTDIAGAQNAGVDSLLVLTGVTGLPELVAAGKDERPTYLSPDLEGLLRAQPEVTTGSDDARVEAGGWRAHVDGGRLQVEGRGTAADWWRAAAVAAWAHLDVCGEAADVTGLTPPEGPAG